MKKIIKTPLQDWEIATLSKLQSVHENKTFDLIISSFSVACTCTKVEFSKAPVSPGKTGTVKITFDTNGKYYLQDREILLTVNTKKKIQKLRFKVFVIPKGE